VAPSDWPSTSEAPHLAEHVVYHPVVATRALELSQAEQYVESIWARVS